MASFSVLGNPGCRDVFLFGKLLSEDENVSC